MLFSSPRFFVFLAVTLLVLTLVKTSVARKKNLLAIASLFFYAAWDVRYLALLLLVSVIDYVAAAKIFASSDSKTRRTWLVLSIVSNLGILGYFKYTNFFLANVAHLTGASVPTLNILLPAGISFYTFKSMSYTIDVYRKEILPCESHLDYATFISFFPELIAGPIVRASVFLPQMDRQIGLTRERFRAGASLFLLGLSKKLLIADQMIGTVDPVFENPTIFSSVTIWSAVIAYAIQIYADFSGYSDMAIGTAKLIGYDLPENFDMPYASTNLTEFWRRWHITLSSWLRDYLYIPLGGNRHGKARTYLNLMVTMLLGGLWHGASWNFVLWGAIHGCLLALHRLMRDRGLPKLPTFIAWPCTFLLVCLAWVPFRAETFAVTKNILWGLVSFRGGATWLSFPLCVCIAVLVAGHVLGLLLFGNSKGSGERPSNAILERLQALGYATSGGLPGPSLLLGTGTVLGSAAVALWLLALYFFGAVETAPFIYFQF